MSFIGYIVICCFLSFLIDVIFNRKLYPGDIGTRERIKKKFIKKE